MPKQITLQNNNKALTTKPQSPGKADIDALKEAHQAELLQLKQVNEQLKTEKAQLERASLISQIRHKHGISDEDMKFISIPDNADIEKFFTAYKQHLN